MTLTFHSSLSKDFSLLLNDADDYNVIIQVGENQNTKEFRAHSVILRARSPYFKRALSTNWIIKKDNMITFNKPNVTPNIFDIILKYFYTGELDLTKHSGNDILDLLVVSDELLLEELFGHIQNYLIEKQSNWVHENNTLVLQTAFKFESCKLKDYCLEFICGNPQLLIGSKTFLSLDKEILFSLLKRDDLQIEEVVIWDYLIKWGIEQTPDLGSNRVEWNNENYKALKKTLNQFIPLIRFVDISRSDLLVKVIPYKAIIPSHIYEEIEKFYYEDILPTLPHRTGKIQSNIIKPKLVNIIANWMDKNSSHKFDLIYRGSRDGIDNESFKNKCNGRIAGYVLIKVKQSNKIFGGYSSIGFSSMDKNLRKNVSLPFYYSLDNFIFSFENNEDTEDTQNMKIGRVVNYSEAMVDYNRTAFNFGWGVLYMKDKILYVNNNQKTYENIFGTSTSYIIEEIETFTIVNN
ncbi:hypothetical protein C1646_663324 [Rhizophagus diaphanus]|nr:hypothetical protein C1646_663324 [Rhizophagus diaphanus] [Rhizophagus sp. MUCL 43196]